MELLTAHFTLFHLRPLVISSGKIQHLQFRSQTSLSIPGLIPSAFHQLVFPRFHQQYPFSSDLLCQTEMSCAQVFPITGLQSSPGLVFSSFDSHIHFVIHHPHLRVLSKLLIRCAPLSSQHYCTVNFSTIYQPQCRCRPSWVEADSEKSHHKNSSSLDMDDWAPVKKSARTTYPGLFGQAEIYLTLSKVQVKKATEQKV